MNIKKPYDAKSVIRRRRELKMVKTNFISILLLTSSLTLAEHEESQYSCPLLGIDFSGNDLDSIHYVSSWNNCGEWISKTNLCLLLFFQVQSVTCIPHVHSGPGAPSVNSAGWRILMRVSWWQPILSVEKEGAFEYMPISWNTKFIQMIWSIYRNHTMHSLKNNKYIESPSHYSRCSLGRLITRRTQNGQYVRWHTPKIISESILLKGIV